MIRILAALLLLHTAHALVFPRIARGLVIKRNALFASDEPIWQIDSDSSEIEAKSSADLRREKEEQERRAREEAERKAREEAERKAREEAERKAKEEAERLAMEAKARESQNQLFARDKQQEKEKPTVSVVPKDSKAVVPGAAPSPSYGLSSGSNSAFDVGRLIAFPVIIGTLALFFLFPFLGPQFADTLPPVPLE